MNFKKIKFNNIFAWNFLVVAFFVVFVVILVLNVVSLGLIKKDLDAINASIDFEAVVLEKDLYEKTTFRINEKENLFDELLLKGVVIKDPSL